MSICPICGKEFDPYYYHNNNRLKRKYCSVDCKIEKWRIFYREKYRKNKKPFETERKCLFCGKVFTATRPDNVYCSAYCCDRYNKIVYHERNCKTCGKEFVTTKKILYCSDECRRIMKNKRQAEWDRLRKQGFSSQRKKENFETIQNICFVCGEKIPNQYTIHKKCLCKTKLQIDKKFIFGG